MLPPTALVADMAMESNGQHSETLIERPVMAGPGGVVLVLVANTLPELRVLMPAAPGWWAPTANRLTAGGCRDLAWEGGMKTVMRASEITRVGAYLRRTLGNPWIVVEAPARPGQPIAVRIGDEFIGTLYRDEEEGEVSYSLSIPILADDLSD